MQAMIDSLLDYARVGTRQKPMESTDFNDVYEQAIKNLRTSIDECQAQITTTNLPTLIADEAQMIHVFQNLIGNALKFRGDDSPRVEVCAEQTNGQWLFSVRDNGIGIKPNYRERVFAIFQRLHTREEYAGTGIGLAICQRIIERHDGRIWVESEPGVGSIFYFTIPLKDTSASWVSSA